MSMMRWKPCCCCCCCCCCCGWPGGCGGGKFGSRTPPCVLRTGEVLSAANWMVLIRFAMICGCCDWMLNNSNGSFEIGPVVIDPVAIDPVGTVFAGCHA